MTTIATDPRFSKSTGPAFTANSRTVAATALIRACFDVADSGFDILWGDWTLLAHQADVLAELLEDVRRHMPEISASDGTRRFVAEMHNELADEFGSHDCSCKHCGSGAGDPHVLANTADGGPEPDIAACNWCQP